MEITGMFEVINLTLALFVVIFALGVLQKSGGKLAESWKWIVAAIFVFGLAEIIGTLKEFGIWKISGLYEIIEFAFIVLLLVGVWKQYITFKETSKR